MTNFEYLKNNHTLADRLDALHARLSDTFPAAQLAGGGNKLEVYVGDVTYQLFPVADGLVSMVCSAPGMAVVEHDGLTVDVVEKMLTARIKAHGEKAPEISLAKYIFRKDDNFGPDESWETSSPGKPAGPVEPEPQPQRNFPPAGESWETANPAKKFAAHLQSLSCRGTVTVHGTQVAIQTAHDVTVIASSSGDRWGVQVYCGTELVQDCGTVSQDVATRIAIATCLKMHNAEVPADDADDDDFEIVEEHESVWEYLAAAAKELGESDNVIRNKSLTNIAALPSIGLSKPGQLSESQNSAAGRTSGESKTAPPAHLTGPRMFRGKPISMNPNRDISKPYADTLGGKVLADVPTMGRMLVEQSDMPDAKKLNIDPATGHVGWTDKNAPDIRPSRKFTGWERHVDQGSLDRLRRNARTK